MIHAHEETDEVELKVIYLVTWVSFVGHVVSLFMYTGLFSYVWVYFDMYWSLLTWYLRTNREMIGPGVSFIGPFLNM